MKYIILFILLFVSVGYSFSQEEFETKNGDTTFIMKKYYFGIYKRGTNKSLDSVQLGELQKTHLAHINSMMKSGKLCMAGPFDDDGDMRGILILCVSSFEEAEKLLLEDPVVITGRLTYEIHPWWGAKGSVLK